MLDYKLLEALATVAQEGGFDKAAKVLFITQSAVSQRVKLLEEHIGQILIARTTPPRITPSGQNLIKHFLQVKHLEDDLALKMDTPSSSTHVSLAVALNADSLATWFPEVIQPFLLAEGVLLDMKVDDQEQTHQLLRDGGVVGCISTKTEPLQGCRADYIGCMRYQLLATPEFSKKWFPQGLTEAAVGRAPAIVFNRKDELHLKLLEKILKTAPDAIPASYIPSSEKFAEFVAMGLGYGMLPSQQSQLLIQTGGLIDLAPGYDVPVRLYWHCWNLKSAHLEKLTHQIISGARAILGD